MGMLGDVFTGMALTGLTSMFEEILRHDPAARMGPQTFDALPPGRRAELARKAPRWLSRLQQTPPMTVTVNLARNMQMSERSGRADRLAAQGRLLEWLAASGIALAPELAFPGSGLVSRSGRSDRASMETIAGSFPLSPTMPRVSPADAESMWRAGPRGVAFAVNPDTVEPMPPGFEAPMRYIYAAALVTEAVDGISRILTLESAFGGSLVYGMFDSLGAHAVLDATPRVTDLSSFRRATFEHIAHLDGVEPSTWQRTE
jgi:hypothetical protein